jgi:subtilisin family serine protease
MKYKVKEKVEIRSNPSLEDVVVLGVLRPGFILDANEVTLDDNKWLRDNNGHYYSKKAFTDATINISDELELNLNLKAEWLRDNFDVSPIWEKATGKGITVAVLDSGIAEHPDLLDNIDEKKLFFVGNSIEDTSGHGTHVAGIIAARGKKHIIGVAPSAKIVPIKVVENSYDTIGNAEV